MKTIKHDDNVFAIYIPKNEEVNGLKFITPQDYPFQIGVMEYAEGKSIRTHKHMSFPFDVQTCQEFLYCTKGCNVEVVVYDNDWIEIEKIYLNEGDAILLVDGGHSINLPPHARLLEVKQGPYPGDDRAKIFKD
ncbi:hypothetical protein KKA47_05710 [bacterium]|nr:hypothetical protein [bacterium]